MVACMFTTSPDEHFILDRHPAMDDAFIAAGFFRPRLQILQRDRAGIGEFLFEGGKEVGVEGSFA